MSITHTVYVDSNVAMVFSFFCRAKNFCLADLCLEGKGGRGGKEASHLRFITAIRIVSIFSVVKEDFIRARIHPVCMFAYKSKHHSKPLIWMALHFCIFLARRKNMVRPTKNICDSFCLSSLSYQFIYRYLRNLSYGLERQKISSSSGFCVTREQIRKMAAFLFYRCLVRTVFLCVTLWTFEETSNRALWSTFYCDPWDFSERSPLQQKRPVQ